MAEPTIVYNWASQLASTTTTPTPAVSVGDLCVVWKTGGATSAGSGVPTGFSTGAAGISNNGTSGRSGIYYKVLTSSDISGGNLISVDLNVAGTTTLRIGLCVVRHPNGWDSSTTLVGGTVFNTNTAAPAVIATMTDVANPVFAITVINASSTSLQYTWAGAPSGFTSARDPYNDDSAGTNTQGGHGANRTDNSGVTVTNGSASVSDTNAIATDLGSNLAGTGTAAFPGGTYVTAVTAGTGFTASAAATASGSGLQVTKPHYGTNTGVLQADYQTFDSADTPGNVTASVGTAQNTYVAVTAEFQVKAVISTRNVTDSAPASDAITQTQFIHRTQTDSAPATDVAVWNQAGHFNLGDSAPATETITRRKLTLVTETATATDIASKTTRISLADTAHATDNLAGYNTGTLDFQLGDPGAGPFLQVDLNVYAKKQNSGDSGDIRISLYDDTTLLAVSSWTALTTSVTLYNLVVPVSTFADSAGLTAVVDVRSPFGSTLATEVTQVYLDASTGFAPAESAPAVDAIRIGPKLHVVDSAPAADGYRVIYGLQDTALAVDAVAVLRVYGKRANIATNSTVTIGQVTTAAVA